MVVKEISLREILAEVRGGELDPKEILNILLDLRNRNITINEVEEELEDLLLRLRN